MTLAEHIAKSSDSPTLVLVGRTELPPESEWPAALEASTTDPVLRGRIESVVQLRTYGARVVVAGCDVTDESAMAAVVARTRKQHGRITSVIHSAGILRDALIALRTPVASSAVVDVKALGALTLWRVLADDPPDLFVLFSSVSSIIGLPGQVDYSAANAFLDAYSAKVNRDERTRAITVNWNAWQQVGMAVTAARVERDLTPVVGPHGSGTTAEMFEVIDADAAIVQFSTGFSRKRHWLLAEHVVRGGESLIPGTGFLEMARAAALEGQPPGPVELQDVFFLSPFVVGDGEVRTLKLTLDRIDRRCRDLQRHRDRTARHGDRGAGRSGAGADARPQRGASPLHAAGRALRRLLGPTIHGLRAALGKSPDHRVRRPRGCGHDGHAARVRVRAARPVAASCAPRRRHRERAGDHPGLRARRDVLRSVLLRTRAVAAPASGNGGESCPPAFGHRRCPGRVRHRDLRRARRGGGFGRGVHDATRQRSDRPDLAPAYRLADRRAGGDRIDRRRRGARGHPAVRGRRRLRPHHRLWDLGAGHRLLGRRRRVDGEGRRRCAGLRRRRHRRRSSVRATERQRGLRTTGHAARARARRDVARRARHRAGRTSTTTSSSSAVTRSSRSGCSRT